MTTTDIIHIIGTIAFAISGYLVGVRKRLDLLGVLIVTLLTAIGGGMLRDVLIGRIPAVFVQHTALITLSVTLAFAWLLKLQNRQKKIITHVFVWADSLGLVAFTITGAQIGLSLHLNLFGVIMLGFATAVGGGIIRDILVNDIPMILRKDFYGSVAILIAFALYVLNHVDLVNPLTLNVLLWGGYALRLLAHYRNWHLPKF